MRFVVVGCSYRTASLALRERLALARADLPALLDQLSRLPDLHEVLALSTCNRFEVYGVATRARHAQRVLQRVLVERAGSEAAEELEGALYRLEDGDALLHIFRVAASLDAMVVGEAQITGQVKRAYEEAARCKTVGPLLNRCMHRAFAAAKRVRTETRIARHPVSVSSVAADLAGRIFGDLAASQVLVLGAGEMAELAIQHLLAAGTTRVRVANRTHERGVELAFKLGARAVRFEELDNQLLLADIVIASTSSTEPVITRDQVARVMRERKQRPLFVVDIAVPHDVDPAVSQLANVYLFNIDDLERVVEDNLRQRRRECGEAERIVQADVEHFQDWMRKQDAVPVIKELRLHFARVARAEAERTAHALHVDGGSERELLDTMADAIVNKLLHDPTMELKEHAARPDGTFLARATRRLFHLPAGEAADEASPDESGEEAE